MRFILPLFSLLFLLASCEDPVILEGNSELLAEAKIVTITNFSPKNGFRAEVSVSGRVTNSDSIQFLDDAIVQVFKGEEPELEYIENLRLRWGDFQNAQNSLKPYYVSNDAVVREGETYTLKIQARDLDEIKAIDKVPSKPEISNFRIDNISKSQISGNVFDNQVFFSFDIVDSPDTIDYYHVAFVEVPLTFYRIRGEDTIFTENFERRQLSIINTLEDDPSIEVLNQKPGFLVEDELFEGETKRLFCVVNTDFNIRNFLMEKLIIHVHRVSTPYFKFQSSLSDQIAVENTPFAEPVILHNNITNGFGNFSAYNTAIDSIRIDN